MLLGDTVPDLTADTMFEEIPFFFSHPANFRPVCIAEMGRTSQLSEELKGWPIGSSLLRPNGVPTWRRTKTTATCSFSNINVLRSIDAMVRDASIEGNAMEKKSSNGTIGMPIT